MRSVFRIVAHRSDSPGHGVGTSPCVCGPQAFDTKHLKLYVSNGEALFVNEDRSERKMLSKPTSVFSKDFMYKTGVPNPTGMRNIEKAENVFWSFVRKNVLNPRIKSQILSWPHLALFKSGCSDNLDEFWQDSIIVCPVVSVTVATEKVHCDDVRLRLIVSGEQFRKLMRKLNKTWGTKLCIGPPNESPQHIWYKDFSGDPFEGEEGYIKGTQIRDVVLSAARFQFIALTDRILQKILTYEDAHSAPIRMEVTADSRRFETRKSFECGKQVGLAWNALIEQESSDYGEISIEGSNLRKRKLEAFLKSQVSLHLFVISNFLPPFEGSKQCKHCFSKQTSGCVMTSFVPDESMLALF